MRPTHARSPVIDAYTLCHVTHDGGKPARMAKAGERVNCPNCRVVVNFCKTIKERYEAPLP
jgi:hypothetical protein